MKQFYFDDIELYESFFLLLLNHANQTTGYVKISQGGTAGTVVDPKIIAKYAIDSLSSSVIIAHNHPSGNLKTSEADIAMTKKIQAGLMLFDIKLLDHLIITSSGFFSMADDGGIL
jgi:DNA repair protein RadC